MLTEVADAPLSVTRRISAPPPTMFSLCGVLLLAGEFARQHFPEAAWHRA